MTICQMLKNGNINRNFLHNLDKQIIILNKKREGVMKNKKVLVLFIIFFPFIESFLLLKLPFVLYIKNLFFLIIIQK